MLRFLAKGSVVVAMLAMPFALSSETASAQQMDCVNYSPCVPDRGNNGLNCDDISFSVRVIGRDHNRFDDDNDGIGCENNGPAPAAPSGSQQPFTLTPAQQASLAAPSTVAAAPAQASADQSAAIAVDDAAGTPAPFALSAAQAASLASPRDAAADEAPTAAPAAQMANSAPAAPPAAPSPICDPNYVPCIPNTTGDALDCSQIAGAVTVVGDDHNNFDTDGDGVGCEGTDESATPAAAVPVTNAAMAEPDTTALAVTGPESSQVLAGLWLVGSGLTMLGLASGVRRRRS